MHVRKVGVTKFGRSLKPSYDRTLLADFVHLSINVWELSRKTQLRVSGERGVTHGVGWGFTDSWSTYNFEFTVKVENAL